MNCRLSVLAAKKAEFIFQFFMDEPISTDASNGEHRSSQISATTTYDDALDFVVAFGEAFPGRLSDPNHKNAARRAADILKQLFDDGWLDRFRQSNHDQYHPANEPNWQYAYSLPHTYIKRIKESRETPTSLAEKWGGVKISEKITTPEGEK